jgi:hypothetical protein
MLDRTGRITASRLCSHEPEGNPRIIWITGRAPTPQPHRTFVIAGPFPFVCDRFHPLSVALGQSRPFGIQPLFEVRGIRDVESLQQVPPIQI